MFFRLKIQELNGNRSITTIINCATEADIDELNKKCDKLGLVSHRKSDTEFTFHHSDSDKSDWLVKVQVSAVFKY